ncbi:unnamed protein product, partial [Closterium sp. NIES-54]
GVTASPLTKRTVTTLAHALLVVALALLLGNWQRISQGSFLLESLPFKAFNFGEAPLPPLHRSGPVCRTCDRASCSFAYLQGLTNLLTLVPPLSGAHSMAAKWAKFQMPSLSDADDLPDGVVIQIVASDWSVVAAPEGDWSQPLGLEKVGGQEGSRVGDVLTVVVVKTSEPNREAASRSLWNMFGFSAASNKTQSVWGRKQEGGSDDDEEEAGEGAEGAEEAEVEEMEVHVSLRAPNGCVLSAHDDGSLRADTPTDAALLDCHVFRVTRNVRSGKFAFF